MHINQRDATTAPPQRHPICVVLDHLRSAYNVGNIFRLAEVAALARVVTIGYTATPPHPKLVKTARGCDQLVPCTHYADTAGALAALRAEGWTIVGVETVPAAPAVWAATFRFPAAFVFGNEALGLSPETLAKCDQVVQLPVFGQKNSLNVGNCAAVVVYQALAQWLAQAPATQR